MSEVDRRNAQREALQDLVSSEGWRVFTALAERMFGPASAVVDLTAAVGAETDMNRIGALTVARINSMNAIERLLRIPQEIIEQGEGER